LLCCNLFEPLCACHLPFFAEIDGEIAARPEAN
jgi:hypothetical protein